MVKPNAKYRNSTLNKIQQTWIKPPRNKPFVTIPIDVLDWESWHGMGSGELLFRQPSENL
jgi:hypothetical protein